MRRKVRRRSLPENEITIVRNRATCEVLSTSFVEKGSRFLMKPNWIRRGTVVALSVFGIFPIVVGCTVASPVGSSPQTPQPLATQLAAPPAQASVTTQSDSQKSVIEANNRFGFDLIHELQRSSPKANFFISPFSLSLLLQMVYNGANGQTSQEIAHVLHVEGMEVSTLNVASKQWQESLAAVPDIELLVGNSIWVRQGYHLLDSFLKTTSTYFNAKAETLDFADPNSPATINKWASDATQGKIDKLFEALDSNVITYLLSAVYFKGAWSQPFDPSQTQPMPFHLADGSEISVPTMSQEGDFAVVTTDSYSALALPYATGKVRMVIVLPNEGITLDSVLGAMTPDTWHSLIEQLNGQTNLLVSLPRFKVEYDARLNDALMTLGMQSSFSQPDFTNMVDGGGVWISYIRHKAIIEVNEEGTEAAAVAVGAMGKSVVPTFSVDRPFFFAILGPAQESAADTILFMGTVYEPK